MPSTSAPEIAAAAVILAPFAVGAGAPPVVDLTRTAAVGEGVGARVGLIVGLVGARVGFGDGAEVVGFVVGLTLGAGEGTAVA